MIKQCLVTRSILGTSLAHAQKSGEISYYGNLTNILSFEAIERERQDGVGPGELSDRPYSEGSKTSMERIQTEIDGKELVWVTGNRRVNQFATMFLSFSGMKLGPTDPSRSF